MNKKIFLFLLACLSIFTLSSCKKDIEAYNWIEEVKVEQQLEVPNELLVKEGTLVVATSPDFSPMEFEDPTQQGDLVYQGADIYLSKYIADYLGLELEISKSTFDGIPTQLDTGKADVAFSGFSYTEDRANSYDFTVSYHAAGDDGQVLVALNSNIDLLNSFEDLNKEEISIGCQNGSIQQSLVTSQLPNAKDVTAQDINTLIQMLKKGSIDALAVSYTNAKPILEAQPDIRLITGFKFEIEEYGNMGLLTKGNKLKPYIDEAIESMPEGLYAAWLDMAGEYVASLNELTNVNEGNFFQRFFNVIANYWDLFLRGTGITLLLSFVTVVMGTVIALLLSFLRKIRFAPLRYVGNIYVEFVRGIPLLLLLWLLYMISPASWPSYISVSIALFLNSGAYVAEIIRAGLGAVDKGQYEAARTLGLSKFQTMKKIVIPQALKKIFPALGNEFVALIKETSLASVFFIGDLMTVKNQITSITYLSIEPFIIVGIIYFILTFGTTKLIKYFEGRMIA